MVSAWMGSSLRVGGAHLAKCHLTVPRIQPFRGCCKDLSQALDLRLLTRKSENGRCLRRSQVPSWRQYRGGPEWPGPSGPAASGVWDRRTHRESPRPGDGGHVCRVRHLIEKVRKLTHFHSCVTFPLNRRVPTGSNGENLLSEMTDSRQAASVRKPTCEW